MLSSASRSSLQILDYKFAGCFWTGREQFLAGGNLPIASLIAGYLVALKWIVPSQTTRIVAFIENKMKAATPNYRIK
jgi:hypothetical protein